MENDLHINFKLYGGVNYFQIGIGKIFWSAQIAESTSG